MFITIDDLKNQNACEQGIRFMSRFYPDGFKMSELVLEKHIPKDFVHWARQHLPCSEITKERYLQRMNIENSTDYCYSSNLQNSQYIWYSENVSDSRHIMNSENVVASQNVSDSEDVESSENIFASSFVSNSAKVFNGNNVTNSHNVVDSRAIIDSKNVVDSADVLSSSEVVGGLELTDCHFCLDCSKLQHCLFCQGQTSGEYLIFNTPVAKERFEIFAKQYSRLFQKCKMEFCETWPPDELLRPAKPRKHGFHAEYYSELDEDFWRWVKTLPGYDPKIIYGITLLPEFLVD